MTPTLSLTEKVKTAVRLAWWLVKALATKRKP
jgi:hypothetical protein